MREYHHIKRPNQFMGECLIQREGRAARIIECRGNLLNRYQSIEFIIINEQEQYALCHIIQTQDKFFADKNPYLLYYHKKKHYYYSSYELNSISIKIDYDPCFALLHELWLEGIHLYP